MQGFPISYSFFGRSYAEKLKMVGNAIPPLFTYYVANALSEIEKPNIVHPQHLPEFPEFSKDAPPATKPDSEGKTYPRSRRFRAAIPNLRFKSGLRFELANNPSQSPVEWRVSFYYGNSKNIHSLEPNEELDRLLEAAVRKAKLQDRINLHSKELWSLIKGLDGESLQDVWSHRIDAGVGPYRIVDALGGVAEDISTLLADVHDPELEEWLVQTLGQDQMGRRRQAFNEKKIRSYAAPILAGLIVMAWFNENFLLCGTVAPNHELAAAE